MSKRKRKAAKMARRSKEGVEELHGLTEGHVSQILRRKSTTQVKQSKRKFSRERLKRQGLEY
jgi:hypothetical protein